MGRKAEETKAKIYYLRNQKLELDRRVLELLSTIDSLKDEQKTMESVLEEKQNQINLLRDKDLNENPQFIALTATLKQKEAQIEELKHLLASRLGIHSNPQRNMTVMEQTGKTEFSHDEGDDNGRDGNETRSSFSHEENKREGFEDGSEKISVLLQKHENLEDSEDTGNHGIDEEKNRADAIDISNDVDEQEKGIKFDEELGKRKDSHQEREIQRLNEGGKELEIDENSKISRFPGKFNPSRKTKGRRWRKVNFGIDAVENMTDSRRLSKEYKDIARSKADETERDETKTEADQRNEMDDRKATLLGDPNSEETGDMNRRKDSAKTNQQKDTGVTGKANNYTQDINNAEVEEAAKDGNETEEDVETTYEQEQGTEEDKGDLFGNIISE